VLERGSAESSFGALLRTVSGASGPQEFPICTPPLQNHPRHPTEGIVAVGLTERAAVGRQPVDLDQHERQNHARRPTVFERLRQGVLEGGAAR
jgi:hypothetical protein